MIFSVNIILISTINALGFEWDWTILHWLKKISLLKLVFPLEICKKLRPVDVNRQSPMVQWMLWPLFTTNAVIDTLNPIHKIIFHLVYTQNKQTSGLDIKNGYLPNHFTSNFLSETNTLPLVGGNHIFLARTGIEPPCYRSIETHPQKHFLFGQHSK